MRVVRSRRRARGRAGLAALAVCGMLGLTACQGGGDAGPGASGAGPTGSSATVTASAGSSATAATPSASKSPAKATATATPAKKPTSAAPRSGATCDHKMPIAPDLIAVRRYTPEGAAHHLIVHHGNWGCTPDGDGTYFEPVGKETFLPLADDAEITATAPVVKGSAPEKISVQQLVDWVVAHPDSGLPFRYHLGADGAIDTLDEVYLP
ncbi:MULTISPECIES: hypothetical protein [unclassified Streptomyces]|uniref:hypothetical protein n=1 Tax=unclassified Streptomyces TaxID=2593676 RepID=UPI002883A95B|nr:hypothetical protein [Streptomyces sp. DSM 41633]